MQSLNQNHSARPVLSQRQLWVIALAIGLLLLVLGVVYLQERNRELGLRVEQLNHRLALAQEILQQDLDRVRADLMFVASLPELGNVQSGDATTLESVSRVFQEFVASQKTYSQIRLIDRRGMEVSRVNWGGETPIVTPPHELQDKADRYYVADSLTLKPGEIFTSEFDLNLENGQIERPVKPVIRFVTAIEQDGGSGDLLVFNYNGSSLLRELSSISLPGRTYLIRDDGEFLMGPKPQSEWGWLLNHGRRFQTIYAGLELEEILGNSNPTVSRQHGLFQSSPVRLDTTPSVLARASTANGSLHFVAHVDFSEAMLNSNKLLYRLFIVGGIMLIPLALITRFWAASVDRREWQNRKIAQSERRLRQLSGQLVSLQEQERRSISREIHDSLGQQATAINLDLRLLIEELPDHTGLQRVVEESGELLKSLHGFASSVRPAELDDIGLKEALESHVWDFESRTGIMSEFTFAENTAEVGDETGTHIFRIVQEALNNISKHANASRVSVALQVDEQQNQIQLEVVDDGVGICGKSGWNGHGDSGQKRLGVLGMRERVELLNGELKLISTEDAGTRLVVRVPNQSNPTDRLGGEHNT